MKCMHVSRGQDTFKLLKSVQRTKYTPTPPPAPDAPSLLKQGGWPGPWGGGGDVVVYFQAHLRDFPAYPSNPKTRAAHGSWRAR